MTDVFFSYSSKDRERVRPIREALIAEGFDVFWDQDVPAGGDWDGTIRLHLKAARCVVVFWSKESVHSPNVTHEAAAGQNSVVQDAKAAKNKLIPVMLDPLEIDDFPLGFYTTQALKLPGAGGPADAVQRLTAAVEEKAIRRWMSRRLAVLEGQVSSLTKTREHLEDSERALLRRIAELEGANEELRREKVRLKTEAGVAQEKAQQLTAQLADYSARADNTISSLDDQLKGVQKELTRLKEESRPLSRNENAESKYINFTHSSHAKNWCNLPNAIVFITIFTQLCSSVLFFLENNPNITDRKILVIAPLLIVYPISIVAPIVLTLLRRNFFILLWGVVALAWPLVLLGEFAFFAEVVKPGVEPTRTISAFFCLALAGACRLIFERYRQRFCAPPSLVWTWGDAPPASSVAQSPSVEGGRRR